MIRRFRCSVLLLVGLSHAAWAEKSTPWFADVSGASDCLLQHVNGADGHLYFSEMMGPGVGLLDFDNDGDLDLYWIQGGSLTGGHKSHPVGDRLCRNDGVDPSTGRIRWTDISKEAGLAVATGYGMGLAVGDVNGDGWLDIYLNNFGPNQLLLNHAGRFVDKTADWGAQEPRWSVSSTFADLNGDGLPELYVGNYVDYSLSKHKVCRTVAGIPDYCSPKSYKPLPDRLFLNKGDHFEDVSVSSGITKAYGGALGVITGDFNGDGRVDIYVANDGLPNQLWVQQKPLVFSDEGMLSGAAVNAQGMAEASMGIEAADFDQDGDLDLFMTHLTRETNTLYVNDGQGWFEDKTARLRLAQGSFAYTGFGTVWDDLDGDGWLDLFVANGAVTRIDAQVAQGDPLPLKQRNQLFRYDKGSYVEVTPFVVDDPQPLRVSRGVAAGDLDNDGDLDLVIANNGGTGQILLNTTQHRASWIGVAPRLAPGKPVVTGVRVTVREGNIERRKFTRRDGSYGSSRDPRVLFGLPSSPDKVSLLLEWPDGTKQTLSNVATNKYHDVIKPTKK